MQWTMAEGMEEGWDMKGLEGVMFNSFGGVGSAVS